MLREPDLRAVWAWSPGVRVCALAPGVPDPGEAGEEFAPGVPPSPLLRLAAGTGEVEGGPRFLFPGGLLGGLPGGHPGGAPRGVPRQLPDRTGPLPVIVSDAEGRRVARRLVRPDNWEPDEWGELVEGELGEWAMAVDGDAPVSICFSPAVNARSAEAGIWTRADHRGRGLAPAVVAAWSRREGARKDVLFYSTSAANHASRAVARSLGLLPLGWIWTLSRTGARPLS